MLTKGKTAEASTSSSLVILEVADIGTVKRGADDLATYCLIASFAPDAETIPSTPSAIPQCRHYIFSKFSNP